MNTQQFNIINEIIVDMYNDELHLHNKVLNFFHSLTTIVFFDRVTVFFFYLDDNGRFQKHSSIALNWEKLHEYVKRYDEYYCGLDDTLPILTQTDPIIFRSSIFFDNDRRKDTIFWKEYLVPNSCIYSIEGNLQLKNSIGLYGGFAFYRGDDKADFTDIDVDIIKTFQPHLSNILKYYGEPASAVSNDIPFSLLDYKSFGMAIFDDKIKIIKSSESYNDILQKYSEFNISDKIYSFCLKHIKDKVSDNKISVQYKFEEFPIYIELSKTILAKDSTQYCCILYDLSVFSNQTLHQVKDKYALSLREFEIVKAILRGESSKEISAELFLSLPTIKRHLSLIYSKMHIKNQKQLTEKLKLLE